MQDEKRLRGQIAAAREMGQVAGREIGREEGKRTTARNLLELGVDMDTIVKATGLTREEILAE